MISKKLTGRKNQLYFILLVVIFLLGFFLRVYNLGAIPSGFHRDEAYLGYNAYSLLLTGRDMTGHFLPLHLESFLFSPAGYSYFSIPFIALFGLSEFSVRFASALFGSLTIVILYYLVINLFPKSENKEKLALISALFLAISPWHINLSRVATENVIVVFLLTSGVLSYLFWVKKQKTYFLLISFLLFFISLFIYQAPRAFLPLVLPLLFFIFKQNNSKKNYISFFSFYLLLIILPVVLILHSPTIAQRIHMLSILENPGSQLVLNEQLREDGGGKSSIVISRIFHNKPTNYSETFLQNYFKHFSYDFLFTDAGLPDRYRIPQMGLLYLIDLPLLLLGIFTLLSKYRKIGVFLSGWVLLSVVGSAITFDDVPNLQRTLLMVPALNIISAYGLIQFWNMKKRKYLSYSLRILVLLFLLYNFAYYLHQYYVHEETHRPWYREEGFKQLVMKVNELSPAYKQIIVTDKEQQPVIFFLFYNKTNPTFYQELIQRKGLDVNGNVNFNKYVFVHDQCPLHQISVYNAKEKIYDNTVNGQKNILYVNYGVCTIIDKNTRNLTDINRSDGTTVYKLLDVQ